MKKNNAPLFAFIFIGLLFLPLITNAGFLQDPVGSILGALGLSDIADGFAKALSVFLVQLLAGIVTTIPNAALQLLNWVASPNFLQISMTGPDNELVTEGWNITRNLANIALIFGLIFIAINIILGSQEVQAKKSLVNFVLIAILINFTPVICGVIIDASNALTSYFLTGGINGNLVNFLAEEINTNKNIDFFALIVFFFFGIFSAVIYLLYALLFAARYIILWILIIVSPLAFASKVFPKSKYITKVFPNLLYWDEWWDQFIQWNVIGIPAGFFIYLSNVAMVKLTAGGIFADSGGISVFGALFTYVMPFLFMAIGFFVTMSSGGPVGSKISGLGKQAWEKTGGRAIGAAKGAAAAGAGYAIGRAKAGGTYIKEGATGRIAGAAYNQGKKDDEKIDWHSREGRDEARQKYREFKKGVKEKAAKYGVISHETANEKNKAEKQAEEFAKKMDLDYFNKHHNDATMTSEQRKAGDIKFMKEDTSAYLKGAGDNKHEYQRRLKVINTYGDNSKEHRKIKTKALMDASFKNKNLAGDTNWGQLYGNIDVNEELKKMSTKDFREIASPEFLRNESNLSNVSAAQLNDIEKYGSKAQSDAINEIRKSYENDNKYDDKGNMIEEGKNNKRIILERQALEEAIKKAEDMKKGSETPGEFGEEGYGDAKRTEKYNAQIKEFEARLETIKNLSRIFTK